MPGDDHANRVTPLSGTQLATGRQAVRHVKACETSLVNAERIAYQGEPGSNSHMVCRRAYPESEYVACASFEEVFAIVEGGDADLAMIPIDNSIAGRVADIHHLLPTSSLHIIGEHFMRIQFSLLGVPGSTLAGTRTVHSHVHALGQCRKLIKQYGLKPVISGDTAGAAREIAENGDPTQAAISPPLAAEIYGLEVLQANAEDEQHNTTRFVVLSRDFAQAPAGHGPVVTTFLFKVRNLPAALYKALGGFATNAVNMTKLESYMVGGHFAATQFLAEVDGHPDELPLRNALEELAFFTTDVKILGVYPADDFRSV
jgi:prephenate dehydratase